MKGDERRKYGKENDKKKWKERERILEVLEGMKREKLPRGRRT